MNGLAFWIWLATAVTAGAGAWGGGTTQPAGPADRLAQSILQQAGICVNVCEMPRVGDGSLAAALAKAGVKHVHCIAADAASAQAARKPATDAGVIGSQVVVETGSPAAIPLQDWTADALVVADATDANLRDLPPAEIRRVLSPYRGVAIVGQPQGGPGGLTAAALTAWANQLGGVAEVKQDATGLWAMVKMPALAGGDDWSHYYHDADGNPVSKDTVVKGPLFGMQWIGGPYWSGKFDVHVVSAGREFHAQSTIYWRTSDGLPYTIRARSLYNGEELWERKIAPDYGDIGSLLVATPDRLYIKDGGSAMALNAETGAELVRYSNKDEEDCKWLMLSDGVLVTMIGPKRDKEWMNGRSNTGKTSDEEQAYENATFYADEMDGWDAASGKNLWQFKENRIDPAKVVVRDGRVFLYANLAYAAALDLKTGKQLWKTPDPIEDPAGPYVGLPNQLNSILTPRQAAMATEKVYFINSKAHMQCVAFAVADGKLLWQKVKGKGKTAQQTSWLADAMLNYPVEIGGMLYDNNYRWRGWDPVTGKPIPGKSLFSYGGCGHFTATESGLLFGQCGGVFDRDSNKWDVADIYSKAACGVSQFAADGLVVKCPADCPACSEWRGFIVSHNLSADPGSPAPALEKGPSYDSSPDNSKADAADWPTYRSTVARCASSAADLPVKPDIRWSFSPLSADQLKQTSPSQFSVLPRAESSPPIAVGGRIFLGTADGAIVCLDQSTGKESWRYWTGGQVMSSPTWYAGRIYSGSADGWLYCLDADTGTLAWRYRVAPADKRIMVFGRLSSPWPIMANVLVQDGTAYAGAGLVGTLDGTVLCALDARTGQLKWMQQLRDDPKDNGILGPPSADGQLAYDRGHLWWHVADSGLKEVDAATGKISSAPDMTSVGFTPGAARWVERLSFFADRGQDIGIMPGGWVAFGGFQFFLPPNQWEQIRAQSLFIQIDATGSATPEVLELDKAHRREFLPAWDDSAVLVVGSTPMYGDKSRPIQPMLWHNFAQSIAAEAAAHPFKAPAGHALTQGMDLRRASKVLPGGDQLEQVLPDRFAHGVRWYTPVLAQNGEVFLGAEGTRWYVYLFSRGDRQMLGRIALPTMPQFGAMSLTREGDVLVPLIDGRLLCIGAPVDTAAHQ